METESPQVEIISQKEPTQNQNSNFRPVEIREKKTLLFSCIKE